ncbi:MAG TPA: ATP-binding cassette domain-containing protein [Rubricoccaceae bacterium]
MLRLENVTKRYGGTVAVDGVSFTAEPGRLVGLLGPNGAGKTSTIRMVTAITTPDTGRVTLGGETVGPATQRRMGYLPEERGLYRKLRVGEQLVYLARLKGMTKTDAVAAVKRWLDRFDASAWWGRRTEELSKGMQQKVQFVATVVHEPDLVVLDEPFSGLDPINADVLEAVIGDLRAAGRTVVFASHRMESVEALCDDVVMMAKGRVVLAGPLREVKRRYGRDTVSVAWSGPDAWLDALVGPTGDGADSTANGSAEASAAASGVRVLRRSAGQATLRLDAGTPPRRVLDAALAGADDVDRFDVHEPPLDEIFRLAVGEA